jgi:hypothetical protein
LLAFIFGLAKNVGEEDGGGADQDDCHYDRIHVNSKKVSW